LRRWRCCRQRNGGWASACARPESPIHAQHRRGGGERTIWVSFDDQGGTQRIYVAQPGPFAIIAALVIAALVLAGIVLLLFGLVLVWIPVVVLVVAALLTTGYIRYYWRRLRQWTASR
jgi:Flp pilus assembly protein TadB